MVYIVTKNTTKRISIPAIELNDSNKWGEHNFTSLNSSKKYIVMNVNNYLLTKT